MMLHQDGSRRVWIEGLPAMDLIPGSSPWTTMDDAASEIHAMVVVAEEGTASTFAALRAVVAELGLVSRALRRPRQPLLPPRRAGKSRARS
ncbi:MAG TPA: hypothetical protein VEH77_19770 [Roseiarcus sp.]|nr:hypothetical protein [Roseiarcus sp.]